MRPNFSNGLEGGEIQMLFLFDMASIFEHVEGFFCHRWAKFAAHNDVCLPMFRV